MVQWTGATGTATKIGSTRQWNQRRKDLAREYPGLLDLLIIDCADYTTAITIERLLQEAFEHWNINYEVGKPWRRCDWFDIPFTTNPPLQIMLDSGAGI